MLRISALPNRIPVLGVSLDIYADSDNEHDELQEINDNQSNSNSFSKSYKAHSLCKSLKQIRKQSNKTPLKESNCRKFKIPHDDISKELKQVKDFLTQSSNCKHRSQTLHPCARPQKSASKLNIKRCKAKKSEEYKKTAENIR